MTNEEAIARIKDHMIIHKINEPQAIYISEALDMAIEALEAEPVKHGKWTWNKRLGEWYCSNCDRIMTPYTVEKSEGEYEMAQPFYCGWCGAKMDKGIEDE